MSFADEESPLFRLAEVVRKMSQADPKGFLGLAEKIAQANPDARKKGFDRRKLSDIANRRSPVLSFNELEALNRFLIQEQGVGLAAVFPSPTIMEAVASEGRVCFLIGAKHRDDRTAVSVWDLRSMEYLLRSIYQTSTMTHVDILDVPLPHLPSTMPQKGLSHMNESEAWRELLNDSDGPSLICLGTQRACMATEVLMARMLGIEPFSPLAGTKSPSPFSFIWSTKQPDEFNSSFSVTPRDIGEGNWQVNSRDWKTWGIRLSQSINSELTEAQLLRVRHDKVRSSGDAWTSYGVIMAQRRPNGQVWLVVSGLSGPETCAGAKIIHTIVKALPSWENLKPAPVLWALFEAGVEENLRQKIGDNRSLLSQKLLFQGYWHPFPIASK